MQRLGKNLDDRVTRRSCDRKKLEHVVHQSKYRPPHCCFSPILNCFEPMHWIGLDEFETEPIRISDRKTGDCGGASTALTTAIRFAPVLAPLRVGFLRRVVLGLH